MSLPFLLKKWVRKWTALFHKIIKRRKKEMNEFIKRICNLLSIKSLVTLILTIVFAALALGGVITGEQFLTVFTVVIAFYFGVQAAKEK